MVAHPQTHKNDRLLVISGGQTGVDRGALDAALDMGFPCGGWCPLGRIDEEGLIPSRYPLREMDRGGYRTRTIKNLSEADGTLVVYFGELEGGTEMTMLQCVRLHRPHRLVDGLELSTTKAAEMVMEFVRSAGLQSLNVAGPRASRRPEGHAYAYALVKEMLAMILDNKRCVDEGAVCEPSPQSLR